jgi:outer membrane murein-binding lipoprotein Lpp
MQKIVNMFVLGAMVATVALSGCSNTQKDGRCKTHKHSHHGEAASKMKKEHGGK